MLIPKGVTIAEIENLYSSVGKNITFEIPNGFRGQRISIIPRLSQFFITLLKIHSPKINFSWVSEDQLIAQQAIIDDPICLTALLMADEVYSSEGRPLKRLMNNLLIKRFDSSIYKKGRSIHMTAVDHSIEKYAMPECFYFEMDGKIGVRESIFYFELIKEYLSEVAKQANFSDDDLVKIGDLLAELIENTDEHALSDYVTGLAQKSVRSVVLNCHQVQNGQNISKVCGEGTPVFDYITNIKHADQPLDILEISIFDSGPGLYRSFEKNPEMATLQEEYTSLSNCFREGVTSKPNGVGFGRGLNKARLILDKKNAFVSIRTGRLSVYRNFHTSPLLNLEDPDKPDVGFYDEINKSDTNFSENSAVEGLAYTILVPLK